MTIELLKQKDATKWDKFVNARKDASFYHQIGYKFVVEKTFGHKGYYLIAKEKNRWQGVLPLFFLQSKIFKNTLLSLPFCNYGGILAKSEKAKKALIEKAKKIAKKEKSRYLELRYLSKQKITKNTRLDKVTMMIDLPKTEEELWRGFSKKVRNYIRRAQKTDLKFRWGNENLIDDFYFPYVENMRLLGSPALPKNYFKNLLKYFPKSVEFLVVYYQKKPIAGACLTYYKKRMEIPYSGALWKKYERFYPNMFLYWQCLKMGLNKKMKSFDFGRSTKNSSNFIFKSRWRAKPIQLFYEQYFSDSKQENLIIHSPKKGGYLLLTKIWRHLPRPVANFLGPKIIKGIPY